MKLKVDHLLTEQVEADFKQFLTASYGLLVHSHQEDRFKKAIFKTCQEFGWVAPELLLSKLKVDSLCPERVSLVQHITVDESYFFRDENQHHFLRNEFLPNLIAQKRLQQDKHIRIWSAGCSTGQEIYSIAILLHQLLMGFSDWELHLIGSDINHQSLQEALDAEYSQWEIRCDESFILQSGYFTALQNGRYQLNEIIKKQVKFFFLNLAEDVFPSLMNQTCNLDLILCRNVFIYFQPQIALQTCVKFSQALRPGGVLMLSATDPINLSVEQLVGKQNGDIFYYERGNDYLDYGLSTISHVEINSAVAPSFASQDEQNNQNEVSEDFSAIKNKILLLLASNHWHDVLALSNQALSTHPKKPDLQQFRAKALVNLGLLDEAKLACEQSIKLDDLDPHSYLLYGLILLQLNLYDEAEKAFRQTIFLNYDFMEAHYQLGRILLYKGQQKQAVKAIKNALGLAEKGNAQQPVHNVITLTYASFAETLRNELSVLYRTGN